MFYEKKFRETDEIKSGPFDHSADVVAKPAASKKSPPAQLLPRSPVSQKIATFAGAKSVPFFMKLVFSFFFLLIMTLNVAIPLAEQLRGSVSYELAEAGTDDPDEEGCPEKEKEKEKEKESISFWHHGAIKLDGFSRERLRKSSFPACGLPLSELYASLPELPPEV